MKFSIGQVFDLIDRTIVYLKYDAENENCTIAMIWKSSKDVELLEMDDFGFYLVVKSEGAYKDE